MDQHLDRMQRRVDDLTRKADDLASMASDLHQLVGEMRKDARQLPLPGLATDGDGEPLAGVAALERRIAELDDAHRRLAIRAAGMDAAIRAAIGHLGDMTVADTARMRSAQRALRSALGEPVAPGQAAD